MSLSTLRKEDEKPRSITAKDLLDNLISLVAWEAFGCLLGVPINDLRRIKENSTSVSSRLVYLFEYLVNEVEDLSWEKIIGTLEAIPEEKELTEKLSKKYFPAKFSRLVSNMEENLQKADFDDIFFFTTDYLQVTFKPPPVNIRDLFKCMQPYYCFMSYKILKVIASKFVENTMKRDMEKYDEVLTKWLKSTTIKEFKETVKNVSITEAVDPSPNQCLVVLRLEGEWLKVTLNNLWKLLEYLFGKESLILTRLRVKEGSRMVLVCLFAPQSKILPLLSSSSILLRSGQVSYLGVLSIQFGNIFLSIPQDEKYSFTFESSLTNAVKSNGSLQSIRFLLDLGADPNNESKVYNSVTPLMLAAGKNNTEIMSLLVEYGANVRKFVTPTFGESFSAIHAAIPTNSTEAIKFLLKNGVPPDHNDPGRKATPLRIASFDLNKDIVLLLIQEGAKVDFQDSDGFSSLAYACNNGFDSMAKLLLDVGADPNLEVQRGVTPLMLACYQKYYNIINMLLQAGAHVNTKSDDNSDGITALHVASSNNDIRLVNILLSADADINIQDAHGKTPMHNACANGNEELVQCFLLKKPNLNLCDKKGKSPLHAAIESKNPKVVKTLLKAGADPKISDGNSGFPPLHWACAVSNEDIIRLILEVPDIDINAPKNDKCETPLLIAAVTGNIKAVELLLSKEAEIDIENKDGTTPIFAAAAIGELGVVSLLLRHGAKTEKNRRGETLLSVTPEHRQRDMEILLQNHMKKENN
ncbi:PREDICTED: ankyrin-1-like [Amphimedon queenslandica]|uniref:Uncharacterized protein n=1 Tax=Amphimedon queenslandica TaxID=400682 RepID=A0A1X7VS06_AMPQE|nr:PREDICTED: ankyrin-1-like [Amphimedon queenslandica]|eukprot:XP_011406422.1 PREDICTED: ankyrin-1-like [Amphimedon queenslandica]